MTDAVVDATKTSAVEAAAGGAKHAEDEGDSRDERQLPEESIREEPSDPAAIVDHHPSSRSWRPMLLAVATVAIVGGYLLFKNLRDLGIWDPYELTLADLGCAKAANAGKVTFAQCGLDPAMKAGDMRSIVMVQTVAWGFRLFGVSEAAGRIPLAIWALAGAIAVTFAVGRLIDARAGLFTGAVLVTMPMYLVQGRLMLGDAATMGAFALALSGLAVATFDREKDGSPTPWAMRAPWAVLGAIGIAAGVGCRGLAVGCTPAAAVGLAWLVRTANTERRDEPNAPLGALIGLAVAVAAVALGIKLAPLEIPGKDDAARQLLNVWTTRSLVVAALVGGGALAMIKGTVDERVERALAGAAIAVGVLGLAEGTVVAMLAEDGKFIPAVGAIAVGTRKFPTFDLLVRQIAHGLFPWSCFLPFALGRILARPATHDRATLRREVDVRVAALLAASIAYGVQTLVAPRFGLIPFAAPVAIAIMIGSVLRDLERAPAGSLAVAIGTAVLIVLVLNDFTFEDLNKSPVELATAPIVEPYGLYAVSIPEELRNKLKLALVVAGAVFLLPIFFVWVDDDPKPGWTKTSTLRRPLQLAIDAWRHPYHGLLLLLLASFEVCIAIAGVFTYRKSLRNLIPQLKALNGAQRDLLVNLWWYLIVGAIGSYVAYAAFLYGRDVFRALRGQRVATIAVGGLVAAGIWSYGIMPAIANQFSPKGVFSTYREVGGGAPIALLGLNARTAAYDLNDAHPPVFQTAQQAYDWLGEGGGRKFLALRGENLADLNWLFRGKSSPRANLPILDGRSAQVLLASNDLGGRANQSPLERMILSSPPTAIDHCDNPEGEICAPAHPLDCNIDNKLRCVGWQLMDEKGAVINEVTSGQRVRLRLIYRVTAPVSGGYQVFIHVEQPSTATARKTWDHIPLQGKYPMDKWLPDDVIVDDSEFNLEPNMHSGAPIQILTGFFSGNTRMTLLSGPDVGAETEGARLLLGSLPVK